MFTFPHVAFEVYSRIVICSPYLLVKRAQKLRKETGDERYWAPLEKRKFTVVQRLEQTIARPFKIFFREPMLIAVTMYMSVRLSVALALNNQTNVASLSSCTVAFTSCSRRTPSSSVKVTASIPVFPG